jgi:hypothetical protein
MNNFLSVTSDLFVNLSAGWFGAVFILPISFKRYKVNWKIFTMNILSGIVCLILAVLFRRINV